LAENILTLDIGSAIGMLRKAIRRVIGRWITGGVVTIDIDSTSIRLLQTKGRVVGKWASVPLEPDKVEEGVVSDQKALGAMVKQLMASSGIKARKILASLSGLYSVSRILPMSILPAGLATEEAVLEMAKEVMPLSLDKVYLSWQIIAAGEGERRVLIVGTPKDVVDSEVRALRKEGINPYILELKAVALTRAVSKEQALILNIEPSSFDIIVVVNGVPEIMRTISSQHEDLALEDRLERLAVNLELTVDFYNLYHSGAPLDPSTPLFITGQVSEEPTLKEKLQTRLEYPIEPLEPPLECPEGLPFSQYAVNIGLALRGMEPSENLGKGGYLPIDINLLPEIYRPWKPSAKQLYAFTFIIAATAVLFPLYQIASDAMATTANLQMKYAALNSLLEERKAEIKKREPLQKAISEHRTIVDMGGGFTEDLEVIKNEAGKIGIKLGAIAHEGKIITFECEADSYITFREYLTALEENGRFATPIPPPEGYPFTQKGTIKLEPKTSK